MNFSSPPPALALVREGKLRAIAVTGEKRIAALPEVPTLTEAGLPGAVITGWHGVFAPSGCRLTLWTGWRRPRGGRRRRRNSSNGWSMTGWSRHRCGRALNSPRRYARNPRFWARKVRELDLKLE